MASIRGVTYSFLHPVRPRGVILECEATTAKDPLNGMDTVLCKMYFGRLR